MTDEPPPGLLAPGQHDVDRAMSEALQELRVVQTGGQIFFAFLFTVAFTPVFTQASDGQRRLHEWALFVVAGSVACLVAPVASHRLNFGRRIRPHLLTALEVFTILGIALLALGIVLGVLLISTFLFPDENVRWLPIGVAVVLVVCWLIVPLVLRARTRSEESMR